MCERAIEGKRNKTEKPVFIKSVMGISPYQEYCRKPGRQYLEQGWNPRPRALTRLSKHLPAHSTPHFRIRPGCDVTATRISTPGVTA